MAKPLANRYIATIITVAAAAYFGATGGYKTIWPVFGAANQLVAALALIVISAYLVGIRKPRIYTVIPAVFMTVTTIGALIYQLFGFIDKGQIVLAGVSILLVVLALFMVWEARGVLLFMKNGKSKSYAYEPEIAQK